MKIGIVSGGFDPLHPGHIQYIKKANELVDFLIVILNNDNWLLDKKNFYLYNEKERFLLLKEYDFVDSIMITQHKRGYNDYTVNETLKEVRKFFPDDELFFINGGDRTEKTIPEENMCEHLKIKMIYNVGGKKITSSRNIMKDAILRMFEEGYK